MKGGQHHLPGRRVLSRLLSHVWAARGVGCRARLDNRCQRRRRFEDRRLKAARPKSTLWQKRDGGTTPSLAPQKQDLSQDVADGWSSSDFLSAAGRTRTHGRIQESKVIDHSNNKEPHPGRAQSRARNSCLLSVHPQRSDERWPAPTGAGTQSPKAYSATQSSPKQEMRNVQTNQIKHTAKKMKCGTSQLSNQSKGAKRVRKSINNQIAHQYASDSGLACVGSRIKNGVEPKIAKPTISQFPIIFARKTCKLRSN